MANTKKAGGFFPGSDTQTGFYFGDNTVRELADMYDYVLWGLAAAIRNPDYHQFLKTFLPKVDAIASEYTTKGKMVQPGAFFEFVYESKKLHKIWMTIDNLYKDRIFPYKDQRFPAENDEAFLSRVRRDLVARFGLLQQAGDPGIDQEVKNFFEETVAERFMNSATDDFNLAMEAFRRTALNLADQTTPVDAALRETDKGADITRRIARTREIEQLFSAKVQSLVRGDSDAMLDALRRSSKVRRITTHSGKGIAAFDDSRNGTGGFHASGLVMFVGGTGGGKTIIKSSILANYVFEDYIKPLILGIGDLNPPKIWGYIGEDTEDSYVKRASVNILARLMKDSSLHKNEEINEALLKPLRTWFGGDEVDFFKFDRAFQLEAEMLESSDPPTDEMLAAVGFLNAYQEWIFPGFSKTYWQRQPMDTEEKLNFTMVSMMKTFERRWEADPDAKPFMVIVDYFGLLQLPKNMSTGNIPKDLAKMAHNLDDWGAQHSLCVLSSVQLSSQGYVSSRDNLRFPEIEDLHESKSIPHSCRMLCSLLPHAVAFNAEGEPVAWKMGVKVLKNRYGKAFQIYLSDYSMSSNIALSDSVRQSPQAWVTHQAAVNQSKGAVADKLGGAPQKGNSYGQKSQGGGGGNHRQQSPGTSAPSSVGKRSHTEGAFETSGAQSSGPKVPKNEDMGM